MGDKDKEILAIIAAITAIYLLSSKSKARAYTGKKLSLRDYIIKVSEENNIDPALVMAIIQTESSWNPKAVRVEPNGYKSIGLMQVTIQAARDVGYTGPESGLFDPMTNVKYGVKYLRKMLDTFNGNVYKAVAAYNAGPGNVKRGRFSFAYVRKVMQRYNYFKRFV